jgi:hypothetical protein
MVETLERIQIRLLSMLGKFEAIAGEEAKAKAYDEMKNALFEIYRMSLKREESGIWNLPANQIIDL